MPCLKVLKVLVAAGDVEKSAFLPRACSGLMYAAVPMIIPAFVAAMLLMSVGELLSDDVGGTAPIAEERHDRLDNPRQCQGPTPGDKKTLQPLLAVPYQVRAGTISPDGRWIAYASNETNRYEVYVQAFPNPGGKLQTSTDVGGEPVWARNGWELFFRNGDNGDKMMAVTISVKGDQLEAGKPMTLFEGRFVASTVSGSDAWYDVSPDGTRVLMLKAEDAQTGTK